MPKHYKEIPAFTALQPTIDSLKSDFDYPTAALEIALQAEIEPDYQAVIEFIVDVASTQEYGQPEFLYRALALFLLLKCRS